MVAFYLLRIGLERTPPCFKKGDTIGKLTIVDYMGICRKDRVKVYLCRCECGETREVIEKDLLSRKIVACCKCSRRERTSPLIKDLTGQIIGPYKVIRKDTQRDHARHVLWVCECTMCHRQRLIRSDLLLNNKPSKCICHWRNYDVDT